MTGVTHESPPLFAMVDVIGQDEHACTNISCFDVSSSLDGFNGICDPEPWATAKSTARVRSIGVTPVGATTNAVWATRKWSGGWHGSVSFEQELTHIIDDGCCKAEKCRNQGEDEAKNGQDESCNHSCNHPKGLDKHEEQKPSHIDINGH